MLLAREMPIDDATLGARSIVRSRTVGDARTSIVIYFDEKVEVVPLDEGASVVIGRSAPADLVVGEPNLSRRHARFTALEQGVKVEDLGSTNGTHYKGERIREVILGAGESVTLGRVTISISRAEGRAHLLGDFLGYFEFVERLKDEVVRARTFRRGVAVYYVRAIESGSAATVAESGSATTVVEVDTHVSAWAPGVRQLLRPVDRMALYGSSAAFILTPETDEDRARVVAAQIASSSPALVVGVSLHHASADELIDQARSVGRAASAKSRVIVGGHDALAGAREPIFASAKMIELSELVDRVSRARVPVLVTGETGAGKDIIAQAIHQRGPRATGPMLVVSCGAMPAELVEDVLFGHVEGAFEGASGAHAGLFERAAGGSLFLDEVGELSERAQAALLRVLESKTIRRLGGEEEIEVDVRVITATNRDLRAMVDAGKFRADLLFRLAAITIVVPPLRERMDDIDAFAKRFLEDASVASGARVRGIDADALAALRAYAWPGNVRELKNALEQAVVACTAETVALEDLPREVWAKDAPREEAQDADESIDLRARVRKYEQGLLTEALEKANGDKAEAAKLLGMPLRALVQKIKAHGLS